MSFFLSKKIQICLCFYFNKNWCEIMNYPETKREEILEIIHGKKVDDPYRWLENFDAPEVQEWLQKQHKYYEQILSKVPNYQKHFREIKDLLSLGTLGVPIQTEQYLFYQKSTTEDQPILYCQDKATNEVKEVVNPNQLSNKNPVALDWFYPSKSGKFLAYGLSANGDEWSELHILNVETNELLAEKIPRTRFCSLCWEKNEKGFYYTRYPIPGTVPEGEENYNKHIFYHKLGTSWEEDPKIFGEGYPPTNHYLVELTEDQQFLLISVMKYTNNDLFLFNLKDGHLISIVENEDFLFSATEIDGEIWILTNKNHPRWALYKTKRATPTEEHWVEVIPESEDIISEVLIVDDSILVKVMRNASDYLKVYSKKGTFLLELDLPAYCSIYQVASGKKISKSTFADNYFGLQSFFITPRIYKFNVTTKKLAIYNEIESPINPENYEVTQIWFPSKDVTKISMFLAHKKGLTRDGNNPTLLCGYGGFNIPIKPPYLKFSRFFWLKKGGIIALANLRGGSEYGEQWHRDGMLEKKQNVFDDFIYAAKWLIQNRYTSKDHLAIFGRSNGGLLTGAVLTQQPELFAAVYIGVPLLDMIRYHLFKIARYWIPEYGSSENKEQFDYLLKYSPYHNVKKGTAYPATMLVTAASDSRVDANHAMKMAAALQWATSSEEPIVLFVEQQAGHGVGKPLNQLAKTETDMYAFLGWKSGLKLD